MPPVTDRAITHFTDYTNLPQIVADGGLYSDSQMLTDGRTFRECADSSIKEARRSKPVPIPPYGYVGDYVPFYYAPRSPMMSAISYGGVNGYKNSHELIYLISSITRVDQAGLQWVCTDGNARTGITEFFNTWEELETQIDWPLMKEKYWRNTVEDGDRKRRRMAEFLVLNFFPFSLVTVVVTYSQKVAEIVHTCLPSGLTVQVRPDLYI